jgi:two-component system sensor histidine kinase/response regulator
MNIMNTKTKAFTILLVDDRAENLVSLEQMLEAENRIFIKATSGNEALRLVLRNEDIGLIMLDVQMPDMDGFEVAHLLKANPKTKDISIIFVTAINKEEQHILKGFEEGAVDYLSKPLDIDVTRAKVNVFEQLYFYQYELRKAISDREKVNAQLERFMYVVAHDLRSPLSGAMGLLYLMGEDERIKQAPDLVEYMNLATGAMSHLSDMITSILDYTRQMEVNQTIESVDVNDLVTQIIHLLFAPPHIEIVIDGPLPVIHCNKLKLQQVFQNLLTNAIKYNDKKAGKINIGGVDRGEFYEFYVKDNGPGIAQRDTDRIFKLFEVVEDQVANGKSSGIGLNILKLLVEEQGGKVWVESVLGVGSCFFFQWRK